MYYDAHTHLNSDQLYPDRSQHLEAFFAIGGKGLVNIGVNDERNRRAIEIAEKSSQTENFVKATIGLHPGETSWGTIRSKQQIDEAMTQLQQVYKQHTDYIVGIGECGIDSHYERNDEIKELQIYAFDQQCQLAQELDLPIVIHSRDNFPLTLEVVKHYPDLNVYFHCRGYGPEEIEQCKDHFPHLRIGFTGNITYPNAESIRQSFEAMLPLESNKGHILLETDAPYLSPQVKRGQQNTPSNSKDIYSYVSETWSIPLETLQVYMQESFLDLYTH
jgi:TatD DNase family protein